MWIVLQWTLECRYLCKILISGLLDKYLGEFHYVAGPVLEGGDKLIIKEQMTCKRINNELILPICSNIVVVQTSILHTTTRVIFFGNTSAIMSLSYFKHFSKIPDPYSSSEALRSLASATSPAPSCIPLIPLLLLSLHFCHLGILSAPWMHQSFPSLFFEKKKKNPLFYF